METNMQTYTLPRETFNLLVEALGNQKAETFAKSMESFLVATDNKAMAGIVEKKEMIKVEVREELRKELVTREMFEGLTKEVRDGFKLVDEKFKMVNEQFKVVNEQFKMVNEQFKAIHGQFRAVDDQFKSVNDRFKWLEDGIADRFKLVDERFKSLDERMEERFKGLNIKLNLFLALALIALTFANPVFVELIRKVF